MIPAGWLQLLVDKILNRSDIFATVHSERDDYLKVPHKIETRRVVPFGGTVFNMLYHFRTTAPYPANQWVTMNRHAANAAELHIKTWSI